MTDVNDEDEAESAAEPNALEEEPVARPPETAKPNVALRPNLLAKKAVGNIRQHRRMM